MQFSRTVAPATSKGPALIAFMQQNNWRRIAILSSTASVFLEIWLGLGQQLNAAGTDVLELAAFEPGNFNGVTLSKVRRSGFRVVLALSVTTDVQTVALLGSRESMTTGWAWLLMEEIVAVKDMAGWLWFRPFLGSDMQAFAKQVSDYSKSHFNITVRADSVDLAYSVALYDAIMLYAYSAAKVLSEGGDLRDGAAITEAVRNTTIDGMGGTAVTLDSNGDRVDSYEVMNFVLEEGEVMISVAVGIFDSVLRQYKGYERPVVWPGSTMEVPADYSLGEL